MSNVGQAPVAILTQALTENVFMQNNLCYNVWKQSMTGALRAISNSPMDNANAYGDGTVEFRTLGVVELAASFNPNDYKNFWLTHQPDGLFNYQTLPTEVQNTLTNLFLSHVAEQANDLLTNGDGTISSIEGIISQLTTGGITSLDGAEPTAAQREANLHIAFGAGAQIGGVGATGDALAAVITSSNVFSIFELLLRKQNRSMRKRPNRKFMVAPSTADLVREAQRLNLNHKGVDVTEAGIMKYGGFEIIVNDDFADGDVVFASMGGDFKTDAFQMGTSSAADMNNLHVAPQGEFNRNWGMLVTFALDIYVARPEEVCIYSVGTDIT